MQSRRHTVGIVDDTDGACVVTPRRREKANEQAILEIVFAQLGHQVGSIDGEVCNAVPLTVGLGRTACRGTGIDIHLPPKNSVNPIDTELRLAASELQRERARERERERERAIGVE
jgi:hypothetical protein